ncbi:anthranilate synthase component 1 [Halolamina pelagica]|uniref:isochorismate synthase n=1 Tax=Halolamina pelagica TaxID=699431 RepID=A0A0N8I009_9EURY|nr:isochorismate synthase [Halolamina pelagica]KPN30995.1 anthranilate synthase component 1 [Halolamina pelagica]
MESSRQAGIDPAETTLVARSREVPDVSFRAFLVGRGAPRVRWAAPDGLEVVGAGEAIRLTSDGAERFQTVRDAAETAFAGATMPDGAARPRFFGGAAFHDDHEPEPPWEGFPPAAFVLPRIQLVRTDEATHLTVTRVDGDTDALEAELETIADEIGQLPAMRPVGGQPGVVASRRTTTEAAWAAGIESAVERIEAGDLRKVVLAVALAVTLEEAVDISDALERLRRSYPDCFRFLIQPTDEAGFFGVPPERLVHLDGDHARTDALAGTVARGDTPEEDAALADSLLESEKLQHEQALVAETIEERLAPMGEVTVAEQGVRKLATVQHLHTPIEADLDGDPHVLDLVDALHPTPAVGGLPPETAERVIRETETFERGWYAAPVGWFDADGDGEFAVGIRSAVAGGRRATLFAGNGIVADSDPADEWEEVSLKFEPILAALEREE